MNSEQYASVKEYLYSLRNQGSKYGIERMHLFADALGHPERSYPIIHVAGTNGKGSTCAMLEAMLRANGYVTGLFTSPHLVHQGERIQVNRKILSEEAIVNYVHELKPVAERLAEADPENHPSFFEFMTAMAFLRFAEAKVDVGIIETGLGGRLDAGNVVEPEVCIITSVGLDHTAILGSDIETIAGEKAGILKQGIPVVLGHLPDEAERVVRKRALELDCPVYTVKERFGEFDHYPETNLVGDYQRINAATAVLALELTQHCWPTKSHVSYEALKTVSWAGRWDVRSVADNKKLILDASHNAEGVVGFEQNIQRFITEYGRKPTIIIGSLGVDRAAELLNVVTRYTEDLVLMVPNQPRACSFEVLEDLIPVNYTGKLRRASVADVIPEKGCCSIGEPGDTVVVTGSIYLLGELLEVLEYGANVSGANLQDI
jgi:dihydrofolate synthase/folylpolyglutamate synthase